MCPLDGFDADRLAVGFALDEERQPATEASESPP